jgi:hypothetical protein
MLSSSPARRWALVEEIQALDKLWAGVSYRAVCAEFNVNESTIDII